MSPPPLTQACIWEGLMIRPRFPAAEVTSAHQLLLQMCSSFAVCLQTRSPVRCWSSAACQTRSGRSGVGGAFAAHAPCLVRVRARGPGCFLSPRFAPPGPANTNLTLPRLSELTMHMSMLRDCACFCLGSHNQAAPERPTC